MNALRFADWQFLVALCIALVLIAAARAAEPLPCRNNGPQFPFKLEQVKAAAPQHPEGKDNPVFKALVAHDHAALAELGHKLLTELLVQANSGMTTEAYDKTIRDWLATAHHPKTKRLYTEMVYKPMQDEQPVLIRESKVGKLDKALDEARAKQWVVVSMKNDWKCIYPDQTKK